MLSLERIKGHMLDAFTPWKPPKRSREQVEGEQKQYWQRFVETNDELCSLLGKGRGIDWARVDVLQTYIMALQPQLHALALELIGIEQEESKTKAAAAATAKKQS